MYTVRIPFEVPTSTRIADGEAEASRDGIRFTLKFDGTYYVLKAEGFSSEQAANAFLGKSNASLACLLLERGIASEALLQPQSISYYPDPMEAAANLSKSFGGKIDGPVDGIIDGSSAAIYPTEKKLRFAIGGRASIYVTTPADHALEILLRGAMLPEAPNIATDPKLLTALKLYGAYFTEQSAKSRFLTLIMALEALATATPKLEIAVALLERWSAEAQVLLDSMPAKSEAAAALEALQRELLFRKDASIRSQIRKLVQRELAGAPDVSEQAQEVVRLYDLRSTLVHQGYLEIQQLDSAVSSAQVLVQRVLQTRFQRMTAGK